jgi:putative ABC transport system substrate-binding protein
VSNATLASKATAEIYSKSKIPIVFVTVSDPVGAGLIEKVRQPTGTNITGIVYSIDREIKLDLIMKVIKSKNFKRPIKVGYISTDYPSSIGELRELEIVANKRGDIEFISRLIPYRDDSDFELMLSEAAEQVRDLEDKIDYLWEPRGPLGESVAYTEMLLKESSHMIMYGNRLDSAKLGALIYFGPDPDVVGKEMALIIKAILNGTSPGEIPPVPPEHFTLGINITSAINENLVITTNILELADENVFY